MNGLPEQISDSPIQSGNTTQSIPDLRLEAKMKAEENARMFGGKQIHPFFLSQKMAKKNQETIDVESNCCSVERKDKSTIFSPIHVFENFQDDAGLLDWGNLILSERSFIGTHCDLKSACSLVFEGSVNPLNFDDILISIQVEHHCVSVRLFNMKLSLWISLLFNQNIGMLYRHRYQLISQWCTMNY